MMSKADNTCKISVIKDQEFKVRCEFIDKSDFFFKDVYVKAYECIKTITSVAVSNGKNNGRNNDGNNNIIVFCGERGEGKTSAMLSFSHTLATESKNKNDSVFGKKAEGFFRVIDPIDPTQFESKDNILSIVLSRIFKEFKDYFKPGQESGGNKNIDIETKNGILNLFQKCYQHIKTIKSGSGGKSDESYDDMLIELATLGDSANLKSELRKLIEEFLKIIRPDYDRNYLVLQIDDMDLNTSRAHEIMEDIRKYLMIPQVIILMATKIEQLSRAVEQSLRSHYDIMIKHNRLNESEPQQMAAKYISKLIPDRYRIFLPQIKAISDLKENIIIDYANEEKITLGSIEAKNSLVPCRGEDFQENILDFIYAKTSIRFIKPEQGAHYIIPRTMRELSNLLSILGGLDNFSRSQGKTNGKARGNGGVSKITAENKLYNIQVFEDYIIKTWIHNHLDDGYITYINDFINTSNNRKHEKIITNLYDILTEHNIISLKNIYDKLNGMEIRNRYIRAMPSGLLLNKYYSIGNVMDTLLKIEDYFPVESIKLFIFAIKTLYTITLYKIYLTNIIAGKDDSCFRSAYKFTGGDLFGSDNIKNFFLQSYSENPSFNFKLENEYSIRELQSIKAYTYFGYKSKNDPICLYSPDNVRTPINFELSVRFFTHMKDLAKENNDAILDFFNMEFIYNIIVFQNQKFRIRQREYRTVSDESLELLREFYDEISNNGKLGEIAEFAKKVLVELGNPEIGNALETLITKNEEIPQTFKYKDYIMDDFFTVGKVISNIEEFIRAFVNYATNKDQEYSVAKMTQLVNLCSEFGAYPLDRTIDEEKNDENVKLLDMVDKVNELIEELVTTAVYTTEDTAQGLVRMLRITL